MIDVINRFFMATKQRDWKAVQQLLADNHTDHTWFGTGMVKPQAVTRMLEQFLDALPDWAGTVDEFIAIDPQTGWCVFRSTGRGTLTKDLAGHKADGRQVAVSEIHCVRVQGGKITEYRQHKHGMFEDPFEESINAPGDLQAARADQGGSIISEKQVAERERLVQAFAAGAISSTELTTQLAQTAEPARCQALLPSNFRRCAKPADSGSIYCKEHREETRTSMNAMHMA